MTERPSWDEYFIGMAHHVATRSTCIRRKVGAIIVKDKHILSTGYNGAPTGLAHCEYRDGGCIRNRLKIPSGTQHEKCMALHAEQNAIIQSAVTGTSIKGGTIYITLQPCVICTKMIINAQLIRVVFCGGYPDESSMGLLSEAGLDIRKMEWDDA